MNGPVGSDVGEVSHTYGLDAEVIDEYDLQPFQAGVIRGAMWVRTDRALIYFKKTRCAEEYLRNTAALCDRLVEAQVLVPSFLRNKYGDSYVLHDVGNFYAMPGFSGHEPTLERTDVFLCAVATLGRWHAAAQGCSRMLDLERIDVIGKWRLARTKLESYREAALYREQPSDMDRLFLSVREDVDRCIEEALEQLTSSRYDQVVDAALHSGTLCHGSYVRQNLLRTHRGLAVLDHEHLYTGPQVLDLAVFLHRYAAAWNWDVDVFAKVLEQYQQSRPMYVEEQRVLAALLRYPEGLMRLLEWYYEKRQGGAESAVVRTFADEIAGVAARADCLSRVFLRDTAGSHEKLLPSSAQLWPVQAAVQVPVHTTFSLASPEADDWINGHPKRRPLPRKRSRRAGSAVDVRGIRPWIATLRSGNPALDSLWTPGRDHFNRSERGVRIRKPAPSPEGAGPSAAEKQRDEHKNLSGQNQQGDDGRQEDHL